MTYNDFMIEIESQEVDATSLHSILTTADVDEQMAIIQELPSIVRKMVAANNKRKLGDILRSFFRRTDGVSSVYTENELELHYQEFAIALLLHSNKSDHAQLKKDEVHRALFVSFKSIIGYLLKKGSLNLSQIKSVYGSYLLSKIIQKYPDLFHLAIACGANVNGPELLEEGANDLDELPSLPSPRFLRANALTPFYHRTPRRGREHSTFTASRSQKEEDCPLYLHLEALRPLTECLYALSHNQSNEQLKEILATLLNHPNINFACCEYPPFQIARCFGVFNEAKEALISHKMREFEGKLIEDNLGTDNVQISLSPYAYKLFDSNVKLSKKDMKMMKNQAVTLQKNGSVPSIGKSISVQQPIFFISFDNNRLEPIEGYTSITIFKDVIPLLQRFRMLPSDLKKLVFSFLVLSEQILLVRNTLFDTEIQQFRKSILDSYKITEDIRENKRKAEEIGTGLSVSELQNNDQDEDAHRFKK